MKVGIIGKGNMGTSVHRLIKKNKHMVSFVDTRIVQKKCDYKSNHRFEHVGFFETIYNSDRKSEHVGFFETNYQDFYNSINTAFPNYQNNILILCVKPNDAMALLEEIDKCRLLISFCAGLSIKTIQEKTKTPVIRCMANLPIEYGKGVITYAHNVQMSSELTNDFLSLVQGPCIEHLEDEKLLDLSTVLTGCMPAFLSFLNQEILNFGIGNGLTVEQTNKLYMATLEGTVEMLKHFENKDIIDRVSSPNGVTEKGIEHMKSSEIRNILHNTLHTSLNSIKTKY